MSTKYRYHPEIKKSGKRRMKWCYDHGFELVSEKTDEPLIFSGKPQGVKTTMILERQFTPQSKIVQEVSKIKYPWTEYEQASKPYILLGDYKIGIDFTDLEFAERIDIQNQLLNQKPIWNTTD